MGQHKVMIEFAPRDSGRDANAIFLKFARGVSQAHKGSEELEAFIAQWSLGAEASQFLQRLEPAVRARVMQEFAPRDAASDVNNIFIRFAQGVANGIPRTGLRTVLVPPILHPVGSPTCHVVPAQAPAHSRRV